MEYTRRAGPPPLDVSHLDSHRPSFSMCRKVRYNVPGFNAPNPNAAACSISLYPYEFHCRNVTNITGTSQFLGRTSIPFSSTERGLPPWISSSWLTFSYSTLYVFAAYVEYTYTSEEVGILIYNSSDFDHQDYLIELPNGRKKLYKHKTGINPCADKRGV